MCKKEHVCHLFRTTQNVTPMQYSYRELCHNLKVKIMGAAQVQNPQHISLNTEPCSHSLMLDI